MELTAYTCTKIVHAAKIIDIDGGVADMTRLLFEGGECVDVDVKYIAKHNPKVDGYYVVYKDGYTSFSPAEAFEEGYNKITIAACRQVVSEKDFEVLCLDEPGQGNACHEYAVQPTTSSKQFARVSFQNGPIKEAGINGCHQEHLLQIVIDRLQSFQAGEYSNADNANALYHVQTALEALNARTKAREARGVEGTHEV